MKKTHALLLCILLCLTLLFAASAMAEEENLSPIEECEHLHTHSDVSEYSYCTTDGVEDPARYHKRVVDDYIDTVCDDCGAWLSGHPAEYNGSTLEEHDFDDYFGYCRDCDYCKHKRTYNYTEYKGSSFQDTGSDDQHSATGTKVTITRCSWCYEEFSRKEEPATWNEGHEYKDGKCTECGHTCSHSYVHTYTEIDYGSSNRTYKDNGSDLNHDVLYPAKQYEKCEYCNQKLSDPVSVTVPYGTRSHYYVNGVCEDCGHKNACKHENLEQQVYENLGNWKYIDNGSDTYHTEQWDVAYRNRCKDCGEWIGETTVGTKTDEHEFHDYNGDGVCFDCGHKNTCKHENAFEREDYGWGGEDDRIYKDTGSDKEHEVTFKEGYSYTFCPDCGQRLSDEKELSVTTTEEHDYDDKGVCRNCGHKSACAHERTHKTTEFKTTTGFTAIDDYEHTRNGLIVTKLVCADCGAELEVLSTEAGSETQPHDYSEEGYCYDCGHLFACKHENREKHYYLDDIATCKFYNEKYHQASGRYWVEDRCLDCGRYFGEDMEYMTRLEEHEYDSKGVCYYCGHKKACKHENLSGGTYYSDGRATYENINNKLVHKSTSITSRRVECLDCGETIEDEIISRESHLEYHFFDENGVCKECGYKTDCKHENTGTSTYWDYNASFTDTGDNKTHSVIGRKMVTEVYCKDCFATLSRTSVPGTPTTEEHYYVANVCQDCGHVNTCKHENTQNVTYVAGLTKDTGDNHTVTGYKFEQVYCTDCGMTVSSKLVDRNGSVSYPHIYVDKLCVECGHVQPEPTPAPTATPAPAASSDDEEEAVETELVYEPVSENTVMHGVKAADRLPAAKALATIGDDLEGEDITVEIPNIEKVLNAEEMTKFNKLNVRERLMVALSAMGFHDIVKAAAGEDADLLSDDALALIDTIAERMANMTEAEKEALAKLLEEFFQKTTMEIDGEVHECFSVDLVITRDGKKTYERYTFINVEDEWVLAQIETGKYKVVA